MKILVIGGMHGNEPLGIKLVKQLQKNPIENVTGIFANEQAIEQNVRFIQNDLNRSFPGEKRSRDYEKARAAKVLQLCKSYDIVLDFHNTHCPNNDCSFVGENANNNLFALSSLIGLKRVIVADYDCLNKYAPNCISIEISLSSEQNDVPSWCRKIKRLSSLQEFPSPTNLETFRFVYRMTLEDRDTFDLAKKNLQAFKPINRNLATKMKVKSPAYPIFIEDNYTPYNFGGLLNKR